MPTATDSRHIEAVRLRREGLSFSQIARELGYGPYPSAARYAYLAGMRAEARTQTSTEQQFGVEIEFYNVDPYLLAEAIRNEGIECQFEGYHHNVRSYWKIVRDGSVSSRGTGVGSGLEMVSPILKNAEGLAELTKVLDVMVRLGAKVNTSCGLHVHLDQAGTTATQRAAFFMNYVGNQHLMDRLVSASRRSGRNSYTRSYTVSDRDWVAERIGTEGHIPTNRYYNLNVASYDKYGTFEVRHHQGTLNAKKIINWIKLVQAINKKSIETESSVQYGSVVELLNAMTTDQDLITFWLRREAKLNPVAVAA